jgi:glycosyltransferase involved in cell wall biosynthesis
LIQVIEKAGAMAVVANTVRGAVYAATAATLSRTPFVWHMRDFWLSEARPSHPQLDTWGKRLLAGAASVVVCNSAAVAERLPRSAGARIVYNGVDINHFQPAQLGDQFRRAHGLSKRAPLIGMVGRLRPWKGQIRFLDVAGRVHDRARQCRFVVVGGDPFDVDDDYATSIVRRTKELGLEEVVTFSGHLGDVRPALEAMDLFVHPGEPEPFGLVNIEAMAMGRPVVAFAQGALPEIVIDGVNGMLVPPNDVDAMAQCILQLLPDVASRSRMGRAARRHVVDSFSIERVVAEYDALLREVMEKKS